MRSERIIFQMVQVVLATILIGVPVPGLAQPVLISLLRQGEQIISVETRSGVAVRVVVAAPNVQPKGIFVVFPGGNGRVILPSGEVLRGGFGRYSFPHFVRQGFVAALVDVPSDQASGGSWPPVPM